MGVKIMMNLEQMEEKLNESWNKSLMQIGVALLGAIFLLEILIMGILAHSVTFQRLFCCWVLDMRSFGMEPPRRIIGLHFLTIREIHFGYCKV